MKITKRAITASSDTESYVVTLSFAGFVGSEKDYHVFANSADEAEDAAKDEAAFDDFEVDSVEEIDDGEWEVQLTFAGFLGVYQEYSVYADSEDEAIETAIDEAKWDLEVVEVR